MHLGNAALIFVFYTKVNELAAAVSVKFKLYKGEEEISEPCMLHGQAFSSIYIACVWDYLKPA